MIKAVRAWRILTAVAIIAAITDLAAGGISRGDFVFYDFFGYFTIQTNVIAVVALVIAAIYAGRERPQWVEWLRISAATYMVIVVVVFWWLLYPTMAEFGAGWTDYVLHLGSGIVLVADWALEGPRTRLPLRNLGVCMIYPFIWLTVVLIRGATDGWVPYFFLDPANGYASVFTMVAIIVAVGLTLCAALIPLARLRVIDPTPAQVAA
ncbi:Pr6Pr family membrane protein [Demequina sp.]|uniref:Pr6Pr family membrane protein n=1 Tax=Demequina sp. TaxID=2050685 RepID=UPI003A8807E5